MVSPGGKRAVHERRLYYGTLVNSNVRHGRTVADVRLHGFAHASDVYILIFFLRAARIDQGPWAVCLRGGTEEGRAGCRKNRKGKTGRRTRLRAGSICLYAVIGRERESCGEILLRTGSRGRPCYPRGPISIRLEEGPNGVSTRREKVGRVREPLCKRFPPI